MAASVSDIPAGLTARVLMELERRIKTRMRLAAFGCAAVAAFAGAVFYRFGVSAISGFGSGGFGQVFSLIFSDFRSVLANWNYYALSLIDSLPIVPLAIALAAGAVLVTMMTLAIAEFRKVGRLGRLMAQGR